MTANVILTIDYSGSMGAMANRTDTYLDSAQHVCDQFLDWVMNDDDDFAVVAFSTSARELYPTSGLATYSKSTSVAAQKAINGLAVDNLTDIAGALTQSYGALGTLKTTRGGIILCSDGMQTVTGDPVAATQAKGTGVPPVFTISLGSLSNKTVMEKIATKSGGKYYAVPSAFELDQIYNDVAAAAKMATILVNRRTKVRRFDVQSVGATVSAGQSEVRFCVSWENKTINYVADYPEKNALTVEIYDPAGHKLDVAPYSAPQSESYAVFRIDDPAAGPWKVEVIFGEATDIDPLNVTIGSLVPAVGSAVEMELAAVPAAAGGGPPDVAVYLDYEGRPLRDARLAVTVDTPRHSVTELLQKHRSAYDGVAVPDHLLSSDLSEADQRLLALRERLLPHLDPFARRTVPRPVVRDAGSDAVARVPLGDLPHPGTHVVHVRAEGTTPDGQGFSRERILSVGDHSGAEAGQPG